MLIFECWPEIARFIGRLFCLTVRHFFNLRSLLGVSMQPCAASFPKIAIIMDIIYDI